MLIRVPCSGSHKSEIKMLASLGSYVEAVGENLLQPKVHLVVSRIHSLIFIELRCPFPFQLPLGRWGGLYLVLA